MRHLLLLTAVACSAAAEGSAHHIRLGLQSLPRDVEVETTTTILGQEVSRTGDERWDQAGRLTLGYQWTMDRTAPVSFILGAGLAFSSLSVEEDDNELRVAETGLYIEPGVAWHVAPIFDLEFGLRLGAGAADAEAQSEDATVEYDTTGYGEMGLHARGVFHFQAGFEIGVELSVSGQSTTIESDGGIDAETEVRTAGGTFGIFAGWRF